MWKIIDTFDDFLRYWSLARPETLPRQIELWRTSYMARYPELLEKQIQDYKDQGKKRGRFYFPCLRKGDASIFLDKHKI